MAWYRYGTSWGGYGNGPNSNWGPLPPDAMKVGKIALYRMGPDYVYSSVYYIPGRPPEREDAVVAGEKGENDVGKVFDVVDLADNAADNACRQAGQ